MYNDLQNRYVVKQVNKLRKEANSSDKKVIWDYLGIAASVALIGVSSLLSKEILPEYSDALTTGLQVLGGVSTCVFGIQAVSNNNERNIKAANADMLERQQTIERLDDAIVIERKIKK